MQGAGNAGGSGPGGALPGLSFPAWTMRQVIAATLTVLGVVLAFVLMYRFYMVVFIFFVAVALEVAMRPAVQWLEARGVRRWLGVLLLYMLLLGVIILIVWLAAPMLIRQTSAMLPQFPDQYQNLRSWLSASPSRLLQSVAAALPVEFPWAAVLAEASGAASATPAADAAAALPAVGAGADVLTTGAGAAEAAAPVSSSWSLLRVGAYGAFVALMIFALSFYWTLERELITRRLEMRIPRQRREQVRGLIAEMEGKIGGYFRGEAILCLVVGGVSTVAFLLIGVPYALALGLIMGIFEAIPVLGPILGAVPAIIITLAAAPDKVFWVIGALFAIQTLEGNLLVPRVMDKSVGVNAIISILALTVFGILFGLGGAILAIPLAAIVQILINRALFDLSVPEETLALGEQGAPGKRDRLALLRMETQELAQDMRKQVRNARDGAGQPDPRSEEAEDRIERIAQDLDAILVQMEKPV